MKGRKERSRITLEEEVVIKRDASKAIGTKPNKAVELISQNKELKVMINIIPELRKSTSKGVRRDNTTTRIDPEAVQNHSIKTKNIEIKSMTTRIADVLLTDKTKNTTRRIECSMMTTSPNRLVSLLSMRRVLK